MKTFKLLLAIALLCFPAVAFSSNDGQSYQVKLKGSNPSSGTNRSDSVIPLTCFIFPDSGYVSLSSDSLDTPAVVELENVNSNVVSNSLVHLSSVDSIIVIPSSGSYVIHIHLADGREYYGEFNI